MSTTTSENREYFIKALNEAINEKFEEEMEGCVEDASCTLRHRLIMKKIAKGKCTCREDLVRMKKRGIMIAIIAAMLALTSCTLAIVYREKIGGFIERVFDDWVWVSPESEINQTDNYPKEIEKVYEFTYVPEGYKLKTEEIKSFAIARTYYSPSGKELRLKQIVHSSEFKLNSENSYTNAFSVENIEIYSRENMLNNYAWQSNGYIFQIHSEEKLSKEELIKIILGVK